MFDQNTDLAFTAGQDAVRGAGEAGYHHLPESLAGWNIHRRGPAMELLRRLAVRMLLPTDSLPSVRFVPNNGNKQGHFAPLNNEIVMASTHVATLLHEMAHWCDRESRDGQGAVKVNRNGRARRDTHGAGFKAQLVLVYKAFREETGLGLAAIGRQAARRRTAAPVDSSLRPSAGDRVQFIGRQRGVRGGRVKVHGVVAKVNRTKADVRCDAGSVWTVPILALESSEKPKPAGSVHGEGTGPELLRQLFDFG